MNEIKPILRWPGAKWRIAKWIASYFPEHGTYLEPFLGAVRYFLPNCRLVQKQLMILIIIS